MSRRPDRQAICLLLATMLLGLPCGAVTPKGVTTEKFGGRDLLVYVPPVLPAPGTRALVIVLHGGLGNAQRIESEASESGLNMDSVAEKNGFLVAYLNGTPVTLRLGADMLGWNAGGGCCGQPAEKKVDDVAYIKGAVGFLTQKYSVDPNHIYGIGHSNGGMMTQRVMCETGLYAAAIAISGPLNLDATTCPAARGKRILAIHGADDENVPIAGGRGTKGISNAVYKPEKRSQETFTNSGASYTLQIVPGADHMLDHIAAVLQRTEGVSIAEKAARFFGLLTSQ